MKTVEIPITNVYMDGDYTGEISVGPGNTKLNVILDTGSSALAIDGHRYKVAAGAGDTVTRLAQTDSYGDGSSWTGAVLQTAVAVGRGTTTATLPSANVAVAYNQSANMFRAADGILGLAYAPLDDAYEMPEQTWPKRYTSSQVMTGKPVQIEPYLTQLAKLGIAADIVSFYTRRSFVNEGGGGAADPLNQGVMIVGGGKGNTDLYSGSFQAVKVLADAWYCTNLKAIRVGSEQPINIPARGASGMPSNSIVDSGTNSLNLGPTLLRAIIARFNTWQQDLLTAAVLDGRAIAASDLGDLRQWPSITFVLQGPTTDATLVVAATDYWQVNAGRVGAALAAITEGQDGNAILGLPLMNGYFTIFDGQADNGRGEILFAPSKR